MLPATIAMYRASLAQARGDVAGTSAHARRALDLAGPDHHFARGAAAAFLGLAAWADGDVPGALETFTAGRGEPARGRKPAGRAQQHRHTRRHVAGSGPARRGAPDLRERAAAGRRPGRFHGAGKRRAARGTERDLPAGRRPQRRQDAPRDGRRVRSKRAHDRKPLPVVRGQCAGGPGRGRPDRALDYLDQAEELFRPGFFPDVRPIPAIKARVWIRQGNLSEAASWARAAGLSVTDGASYMQEYSHLTLVRLLIAQQRAHPDTTRPQAPWTCWTGYSPAPRTPGVRAAWWRSACCRPLRTTCWAIAARPSRRSVLRLPDHPNRMSTCGCSWTKGRP